MRTTSGTPEPLMQAALFAGRAPSLHNSQPWHWYVRSGELDLRLERDRVLSVGDPRARLAVLSCGAGLHHAHMHLAAAGWEVDVVRLPDAGDPDLLARLRLGHRQQPDPDAVRLTRAANRRHTDRRSVPAALLDMHRVHTVRKVVRRAGAELTVLRPHQVFTLAETAEDAYAAETGDTAWREETASWLGPDRPEGAGIPPAALPAGSQRDEMAESPRLIRRAGTALIDESQHHTAVFALLCTEGDGRLDWLAAGYALSAGWLTAVSLDVSVLPLSIVTEVAAGRDRLRALLPTAGNPQIALRLAVAGGWTGPPTPRLPREAFVSGPPAPADGAEGPAKTDPARTGVRAGDPGAGPGPNRQ